MRGRIGDFTREYIGKSRKVVSGWRDFDLFHPDAVVSNPNSQVSSLTVSATQQIQVTLTDALTGQDKLKDFDVYAIPLTDKHGVGITFADSFQLKTQIEFISISGDFKGTNEHSPVFGMGIGQHSDADNATNHYIGASYLIDAVSGSDPNFKAWYFHTSGDDAHNETGPSGTRGLNGKQMITNYFVGPCVGATARDTDTVFLSNSLYKNATDSYDITTATPVLATQELTGAAGVFDVDTQVYLYAYFGSKITADGSNDPSVVTCKMRYLVNANYGKAGSGAA